MGLPSPSLPPDWQGSRVTGKWSNGNYTLTFGPIFLMRLFMSFYLPAPVGTKRGDLSETGSC